MEYGELMKDIRFEFEVRQKDMAKILGISRSTYSDFEQQYNIIPLKHLIKFCNHFDINMDYILGLTKIRKYNDLKYEVITKNVGLNIRKLRRENKMQQQELANKLHITSASLSSYERGRRLVSTGTLYSVCKLFNVSADFILNRTTNKYLDNLKELVQN